MMTFARGHLRVLAAAWLMFQGVWLAVLVPADCCPPHRPARPSCHEQAAPTQCPMPGADGVACPMHRAPTGHSADGAAADTGHRRPAPATGCSLEGSCDGPMASLLSFLSHQGILARSVSVAAALDVRRVPANHQVAPADSILPPDSPPPRA
jgi:hypothetical protein